MLRVLCSENVDKEKVRYKIPIIKMERILPTVNTESPAQLDEVEFSIDSTVWWLCEESHKHIVRKGFEKYIHTPISSFSFPLHVTFKVCEYTDNPLQSNVLQSTIDFCSLSYSVSPQPMRPLKATATTSKPVLTMEQIETIFYKIQDIYEIHKEFYDALYPNIQQWDDKVTVGHLFQKLVS